MLLRARVEDIIESEEGGCPVGDAVVRDRVVVTEDFVQVETGEGADVGVYLECRIVRYIG